MAVFIRQRKLKDNIAKDISHIVEFRFTAWDFISPIYKSRYDKLNTNKNSNSFRQYIASQFKAKAPINKLDNNQDLIKPSKQVNFFRIPPYLSPRLSKKVLEKSKFYKAKMSCSSTLV